MNAINPLLIVGLVGLSGLLLVLAATLPAPRWMSDDSERILAVQRPSSNSFIVLLVPLLSLGAFVAGLPLVLSVILGVSAVAIVLPVVSSYKKKKLAEAARKEALTAAEYIAGRISVNATPLTAIDGLVHEHSAGRLQLNILHAGFDRVSRKVNLGGDLTEELRNVALMYEHLPEIQRFWNKLSVLTENPLGAQSLASQAEDIAHSMRFLLDIYETQTTELTMATTTRYFMTGLVVATALYVMTSSGPMGEVLINQLAGNIILGFALFLLYLAQIVGQVIEKLPPIEF